MMIRAATEADAQALAEIYAYHVLHGVGTFEETPPTAEDMDARRRSVTRHGLPWLVAEEDGRVLAYAYAAPFRPRAAYRYTVEDSVYVARDAQGRGVGRAVLAQVLAECEAMGLRQVIAVIGDSANAGSIALHAALGFQHLGMARSVGFKHGRWIDVVWMQKPLNGGDISLPDAAGLSLSGH